MVLHFVLTIDFKNLTHGEQKQQMKQQKRVSRKDAAEKCGKKCVDPSGKIIPSIDVLIAVVSPVQKDDGQALNNRLKNQYSQRVSVEIVVNFWEDPR